MPPPPPEGGHFDGIKIKHFEGAVNVAPAGKIFLPRPQKNYDAGKKFPPHPKKLLCRQKVPPHNKLPGGGNPCGGGGMHTLLNFVSQKRKLCAGCHQKF